MMAKERGFPTIVKSVHAAFGVAHQTSIETCTSIIGGLTFISVWQVALEIFHAKILTFMGKMSK
jgi:hypothetical protein